MSPQRSTLLALIGVLLAGIPLPALTAARREAPAEAEPSATPAETRTIYAQLQCSGQPTELRLLHEGRELARLHAEQLALLPCEQELCLPARGPLALEVSARWAEGGQSPQAVTLTLEPEGLPARQCTGWTEAGSDSLNTVFNFTW